MDDLVSIIIVTYNCKNYMDECLTSMMKQDYPHEIIIVDNASEDGTPNYIRENYPTVKVIETGDDLGYGTGNNIGVNYASGKYVVIINPDTIVHDGWLRELVTPLQNNPMRVTVPKSLSWDGKEINSIGLSLHPTGLCGSYVLGDPADTHLSVKEIYGASGLCFSMHRDTYLEIGGFDENIFMYGEDLELSWKFFLHEFNVSYIPTAIMRHDWKTKVSPSKIYYLEWGRHYVINKYYSKKEKLLLMPSFFLTGLLSFCYALTKGVCGVQMLIKAKRDTHNIKAISNPGNKNRLYAIFEPKLPQSIVASRVPSPLLYTAVPLINMIYTINYRIFRHCCR